MTISYRAVKEPMLRSGLIGLPSVGKTTLFALLTNPRTGLAHPSRGQARAEANLGVAQVPDDRLLTLSSMFRPRKTVPATIEFVDIAGLTGSDAKVLFDLAAFRTADALTHVVRAFEDPAVPHVEATLDPARDARAMEEELMLADLAMVEKRLERLEKDLKKMRSAEHERERDVLVRARQTLESGEPLRSLTLAGDDLRRMRGFAFLSLKPLLLVVNLDERDLPEASRFVQKFGLTAFAARSQIRLVEACAKIELEIAQLEPDEARAFMADLGIAESGLDRIVRASYDLLGYITFFTINEDECRGWSISRGSSAHQAAGVIHSDLERGFIRAEVAHYDDLVACGSIAACRDRGLLRLEGKDYVVRDGDLLNVRFAV